MCRDFQLGLRLINMQQFWTAFLTIWTFVSLASSIQLVLEKTAHHDWNWITKGSGVAQWERRTNPTRYTACNFDLQQSNNWLLSDQIAVTEANRIDITVTYQIRSCSNCVNVFDLYVNQSDQFIADQFEYPNPLSDTTAYEKVAEIKQAINKRNSETINVLVKGKHVILAFHNYGACSLLFSVKVTYNVCPGVSLTDSLVSLPRTAAPANDSEPIQVEGICNKDAVQVSGSLYIHCKSNGEWNTTVLEARCICMEDLQNNGGICEACPVGKYNDKGGLNCTILPSVPRNVTITFVNQSAIEIRWLPPVMTGNQTQVYYDVSCRKPCNSNKRCLEEYCERDVNYIPNKEGLNTTQVIVADLYPFVSYRFKIYAKNRVSEVAKRRHGIDGDFIAIAVRTNGSTTTTTVPITEDSKTAMHKNIIYGLVGFVGLLIVLIVPFACCKISKRWRRRKKAKRNKRPIAGQSGIRVDDGKARS